MIEVRFRIIYRLCNLGRKTILNEINGRFQASELTAIMGASGSGKSTLLNLLSGFERKNLNGEIRMNGLEIDKFRQHIVYIMQDNYLQLLLTVSESMNFAIKLKTGNSINAYKKWKKISEILETFGLAEIEHEYVKNLSGGQQKRLAIALEIVDDPLVIFLDVSNKCLQLFQLIINHLLLLGDKKKKKYFNLYSNLLYN